MSLPHLLAYKYEPERGLDLLPEAWHAEGEESIRQWRHLQPGNPSASAGSLYLAGPVAWGVAGSRSGADLVASASDQRVWASADCACGSTSSSLGGDPISSSDPHFNSLVFHESGGGKGNHFIVPIGPGLLPAADAAGLPLWAQGTKLSPALRRRAVLPWGRPWISGAGPQGPGTSSPEATSCHGGRLKRISHSCSPGESLYRNSMRCTVLNFILQF